MTRYLCSLLKLYAIHRYISEAFSSSQVSESGYFTSKYLSDYGLGMEEGEGSLKRIPEPMRPTKPSFTKNYLACAPIDGSWNQITYKGRKNVCIGCTSMLPQVGEPSTRKYDPQFAPAIAILTNRIRSAKPALPVIGSERGPVGGGVPKFNARGTYNLRHHGSSPPLYVVLVLHFP